MAFASPNITAIAVEATEFPDLARKYQVTGVPKTVVNDAVEILGALPQDAFIEQALSDAAAVCSLFSMIVRLADSLGWDVPTRDRLTERAPAMLEGGYAISAMRRR